MPSPLRDIRDRLLAMSEPEPNSGCWIWIGNTVKGGYGRIQLGSSQGRRKELAHRAAYEAWTGPIPTASEVRHRCDVPPCINPGHLIPGSGEENMKDRLTRGRTAIGSRNGQSVLSAESVAEIRRRHALGDGQRSLAREFQVGRTTISNVVHHNTWRELEYPPSAAAAKALSA